MADISHFKLHDVIYDVKDIVARNMGVPTGGTVGQVLAKNSGADYDTGWADPGSTPSQGSSILYFYQQPVNAATAAEIMRITNNAITVDTVVLNCIFSDPSYITSAVQWTSYAGYISFIGTAAAATTANVTLGQKD